MPSIRALALALTAAVLPAVTLAAPAAQQRRDAQTGHWGPHHGHGQGYGKEAIYFLRVDPAGSSVVAIEVDSDGLLTDKTTSTSTGGNGQQATNATSGTAVGIDPLQGQQAVSVGENVLLPEFVESVAAMCNNEYSNSIYSPLTRAPIPSSCSASIQKTRWS